MIRAGMLTEKLTLKRPGNGAGGSGTDAWGKVTASDASVVAALWCDVQPASGSERLQHAQLEAEVTHRITSRVVPGVTPTPRDFLESAGGRVFKIVSVINSGERDRKWQFLAREDV